MHLYRVVNKEQLETLQERYPRIFLR